MKRIIKNSLALMAIFTSMAGYSGGNDFISKFENNNITTIYFEDVRKGAVLSIVDSEGVLLHSEKIKKEGPYKKGFDFSSLPDAEYLIELHNIEELIITPLCVKNKLASLKMSDRYKIEKTKITVSGDTVHITNSHPGVNSVEIEIYYEGDNLAFNEKLENIEQLNRAYSFSGSRKGNYTIVLISERGIIQRKITI